MGSQHRGSSRRSAHTTPSEPLLSACLVVRDEAEMLPDCLASLRGVADEIVVVDTGSTDGTPEIARQLGARVSHFQWCDDFAAARNAALDRAHGRWVLQIDADERLTAPGGGPADGPALRRWLKNPPAQVLTLDMLALPLRNVVGRVEEVAYVPRLFARRSDRRYVRRIHETPFPPDMPWHSARLGGCELRHLGYAPDVVARKGKHARNLRLCEVAVQERPEDVEIQYQYGRELYRAGRKQEALLHYTEAWKKMPIWLEGSVGWWFLVVALGEGLNEDGHPGLVLDWVAQIWARFPNVAHLHFLRGEALRLLGRYDDALTSLRAALVLPPAGVAWEPWTTKAFSWSSIGAIYEQASRLDQARQAYRQSLAIGPTTFAQERLAALQVTTQADGSTGPAVAAVARGCAL